MSDVQKLQDSMLRAARGHGMSPEQADTVFSGLAKRIEAGEAAPDPGPLSMDRERTMVWGPWVLGAAIGAAAVAALVVGGSLRGEASSEDNAVAAPYEAAPRGETDQADSRPRRAGTPRSKPTPGPGPTFEVPVEPEPTSDQHRPLRGSSAPVTASPAKRSRPKQSPSSPEPRAPSTDRPASTTDVAGETRALAEAQAALDRNDLGAAKRAISSYRKAHPKGALAPEADALAVLIECKRGTPGSTRDAARFVRRHPRSALRKRIDSACEKK